MQLCCREGDHHTCLISIMLDSLYEFHIVRNMEGGNSELYQGFYQGMQEVHLPDDLLTLYDVTEL